MKPKLRKQHGSPNVLPVRVGARHNRFVSRGAYPTTLDGIAIYLSTKADAHTYALPELEGDVYRTLRQWGLCLARYQVVDKPKLLRRTKHAAQTLAVAERIIANNTYTAIFGTDPSIGTTHLDPLKSALKGNEPSYDAIMATLSYVGTDAFNQLMKVISPTTCAYQPLQKAAERIIGRYGVTCDGGGGVMGKASGLSNIMCFVGSAKRWDKRDFAYEYGVLCNYIERCHGEIEAEKEGRKGGRRTATSGRASQDPKRGKPTNIKYLTYDGEEGWERAWLSRPELTISHTGKKGRRIIANNEGKHIRNIGRLITDPERRIFSRKTRSLGGVVVVDCSGSMSLTDDELNLIMESSAGCTVVAYSSGNGQRQPNIWLLARRGRQVRHLPNFPGGNGVDGIALKYGESFRVHHCPMVWISDTMVTGKSGYGNEELRERCMKFCKDNGVHIVGNAQRAATLLSKLQQGQIIITKESDYV